MNIFSITKRFKNAKDSLEEEIYFNLNVTFLEK